MTLLFAAFLATFLLGIGGRDQVLIAALAAKLGRRASLLAAGLVAAAMTACVATWLARWIDSAIGGRGTINLALLAAGLAGLQMAWDKPGRLPLEPTRSLGAITLGVLVLQLADPVRLATISLGLFKPDILCAIGAAGGAGASVTAGWLAHRQLPVDFLRRVRKWLGMGLIGFAGTLALALR